MAQTKRKRRRKHRGTQSGRIDSRPARGRPRNRAEAQARARQRGSGKKKAGARTPEPPSWGNAAKKGLIAALIFFGLLALLGQNPLATGLVALVMLGFYVPMAYLVDGFFWRRELRKQERERLARAEQRTGPPSQ
jgi:hypothetical protein